MTRLSVCIATFNRAGLIGETLRSIVPQMTDETELVIVDGASTDTTADVVQEFAGADERIRYHRLDKNSGVDKDFNTAVEIARGHYCWLMSDDDLLKPGAVARVMSALESSPSLVIVNAETRTPDLRSVLKPNMLRISQDERYAPSEGEQLFIRAGQYLSFIGCVVIRRDLWLSRNRDPYYGSLFIHVGVIFQRRLPGDAIVLSEPLISIRYGNAMWTPRSLEIWMFKWPALVWSFTDFSEGARDRVYRRKPYLRLSTLALFRAKGALGLTNYARSIAPNISSPLRKLAGYAIAATPGVLVNTIISLILRSRPTREEMPLFELRTSPHHYRRVLKFGPAASRST
jgi:glycosyltransferase involved in cell wall biosynthesis